MEKTVLYQHLNSFQLNLNAYNHFFDCIGEGRGFCESDFQYKRNEKVPIILGNDYKSYYSIGDSIKLNYLGKDFEYEIIGFFEQGLNIKIENSIPVNDNIGRQTDPYNFSVANEDSDETGYVIYLDDVEIDNEINRMKDTVVKYQLIENGKEQVGFVSELGTHPFRILTSGVMNGNETNNYSLRFWIKEDAEISAGQNI